MYIQWFNVNSIRYKKYKIHLKQKKNTATINIFKSFDTSRPGFLEFYRVGDLKGM